MRFNVLIFYEGIIMKSILLSFFILVHVPIVGMGDESETTLSDCCGLGSMVYNVTKHIGRNDFLYLAYTDSTWYLRMKLESREYFENLDKYYVRSGRLVNETNLSVFHTPLHEAVKEGNIEAVKLLCAAGADVHKKIKNALEIKPEEVTREPHGAVYFAKSGNYSIDDEIQDIKKFFHVGLSALELAEVMRKKSENKPSEREEIERLLKAFAKKSS
jgi:hypothetical protein